MRPLAPPKGGGSSDQSQLVRPLVFRLLMPNVFPDHRLVPTHRRHEVPARPEVLPHEVPAAFSVVPRNVDRTLPPLRVT